MSETAPMGAQLRVLPLQRAGLARRLLEYYFLGSLAIPALVVRFQSAGIFWIAAKEGFMNLAEMYLKDSEKARAFVDLLANKLHRELVDALEMSDDEFLGISNDFGDIDVPLDEAAVKGWRLKADTYYGEIFYSKWSEEGELVAYFDNSVTSDSVMRLACEDKVSDIYGDNEEVYDRLVRKARILDRHDSCSDCLVLLSDEFKSLENKRLPVGDKAESLEMCRKAIVNALESVGF